MMNPPAAIRERVESEPGQRVDREEIAPRATLWVDAITDDPQAFAHSVARGLSTHPRHLDCRYLYDEIGSELFAAITEQPEYYPTRAEASILARDARRLAKELGAVPVVELGSGTSDKTALLLDAWAEEGGDDFHYIPVDIDPFVVRSAAARLVERHPRLHVSGLATSYENALDRTRDISPKLVLFLGSTLGNFAPEALDKFLGHVESGLQPGDHFLLGVDLVKARETLEAAYNDAAGVTERFTLNLFARMNRELEAGIPEDAVEHLAFWNDAREQIEIYGRFRRPVRIELPVLEQSFDVAADERILVEVSRKFRVERLARELAGRRLALEQTLTDDGERFALLLLRRVAEPPLPAAG